MTKAQIFQLITNNPAFRLATVDGNKPRVRGMLIYRADENGIIFHSGANKDIYKQVLANPNAELCFNDFATGTQVRVSGRLEIVEDTALKDEISNHPSREFLQPWKNSVSLDEFYKGLIVFNLKGGTAVVWTFQTNFAPKVEIQL